MTTINDPITIKSVTIKNRIGMSPMCQYSSKDGFAIHIPEYIRSRFPVISVHCLFKND